VWYATTRRSRGVKIRLRISGPARTRRIPSSKSCLVSLVVARMQVARSTPAADGVDLVDENDAGGRFPGLREEVAHPRRPHADEHLDEI